MDVSKFTISFPRYFELHSERNVMECGEFVISWPNYSMRKDSFGFPGNEEYIIEWPDYLFGCDAVGIGNDFVLNWPEFLFVNGKPKLNNLCEGDKNIRFHGDIKGGPFTIGWPEYNFDKDTADYSKAIKVSEKKHRNFYYSSFTTSRAASFYDHSENFKGVQYVSGHYRRLKNGSTVYVKPHRRVR
ncbi:hypothetical protein LRP50_08450 [Enterovibrio sp. ZSDZ42]|uniref:Uncharacterized protein n=1 Tax=Enterovibrio gelatinilyticus TaxID=2899819 RepID=A0ABT5QYR2_9GAMM|nr:hypothetical protein [Enterovibrio sp. ZSDZ42]MDD1793153.1 hypothetical protein [Enterovibrio sp. ZSDZ42]